MQYILESFTASIVTGDGSDCFRKEANPPKYSLEKA